MILQFLVLAFIFYLIFGITEKLETYKLGKIYFLTQEKAQKNIQARHFFQ